MWSYKTLSKEEQKKQLDKFIEAARELECDESEEVFTEKLKKLAETEPKKEED